MKMGMRGAAASLLLGAITITGVVVAQDKTSLTTEKDKVSYAIGLDVARSFAPVAQDIDVAALQRATENAISGGKPLLSDADTQATDAALRASVSARQGQPVPGAAPGTQPAPVNKANVGLMLGDRAIGPALANIKNDIELPVVFQAVRTAFANGTPLLTQADAQAVMQAFGSRKQAEVTSKNREEGAAFLAKNKAEKGVITTPSGLQYMVLRAGNGQRPTADSHVRVNYEGKLLDGTVFDSSYQRGQPAEFGLGQVIAGWTEGLQLMPVGAKYRFWIPSELAYGSKGTPGGPIGPDAALTFDVELLGVQ